MKLFLFLDDWFLDSKTDIVRQFASPVQIPVPDAHLLRRSAIILDAGRKKFVAICKKHDTDNLPGIYRSEDGIQWDKHHSPINLRFPGYPKDKHLSLPVLFPEQGMFYDQWDDVPERRYKMLLWPYKEGMNGGPGVIACSPDGIDWTIHPEYAWTRNPNGSDTNNNMFYNPVRKNWAVICRKSNLDRRIAMVESPDLENWTEPRIILQPDTLDPALLQFYGMAATCYEDEYFLGILQRHNVPSREINPWSEGRVKMEGTIDTELTYSYDGAYWLRAARTPFISRTEPGTYGGSSVYPHAILPAPDGKIHIYSNGCLQDHSIAATPEGYPSNSMLMLHAIRHDGFAFLEPSGGRGTFLTRTLIPKNRHFTVNYQAPLGEVLIQITDSRRQPLPGYSFKDCIPLKGDEVYGNVRWKKHRNLASLTGKPIRLEFNLLDARIYAFRLDCNLWYGYWPETKMSRV